MSELPSYTNEEREKRAKNELEEIAGVEKNTLLRSKWDKATYQITKLTDTHAYTDDGKKHLWTNLRESIKAGNAKVIGTRATN